MLSSVLGLWKARQARKAAIAVISPLVEGSRDRLNGIPDRAWLDPYMVGFMVMLITLVAKREVGVHDRELGLVQSEAWGAITGMKPDLIGEETLLLSSAQNQDFEFGCHNAVDFGQTLWAALDGAGAGIASAVDAASVASDRSASALWAQHFDAHVSAAPLPSSLLMRIPD